MKKTGLLLIISLFALTLVHAQYEPAYNNKKPATTASEKGLRQTYLGIGTSLYGKYGFLGINCGYRFAPKTIGEVHLGLGGWGYKAGFSVTTHVLGRNTWCPTIGISRNSGAQNVPGNQTEVVHTITNEKFKVNTNLNYNPMTILHLGVQRQVITARNHRLVLELGYSLALTNMEVEFADRTVQVGNTTIPTDMLKFSDTQHDMFVAANPAGIMIGLVYQWGFGIYE